jgi:uncharacterized membrane protein
MADDVDLTKVGPMQLIAVAFDEPDFKGEIDTELKKLRDNNQVRVVDGVVIFKDKDGNVAVRQESDLTAEENRTYGAIIGGLLGIGSGDVETAAKTADYMAQRFDERYQYGLDEADVREIASDLPKGDAALVLLLEHVWLIPLRNAMRDAHGMLLSEDFLSPELLISVGSEAAGKIPATAS